MRYLVLFLILIGCASEVKPISNSLDTELCNLIGDSLDATVSILVLQTNDWVCNITTQSEIFIFKSQDLEGINNYVNTLGSITEPDLESPVTETIINIFVPKHHLYKKCKRRNYEEK